MQIQRVLIGYGGLIGHNFEHFKIGVGKPGSTILVEDLYNTDTLIPNPHRNCEHVLGFVTGGLLYCGGKPRIVRDIVYDETPIIFYYPAGYSLVHLDYELFRFKSLWTERNLEPERTGFLIHKEQ